jgi:hypothetical protein
MFQSVSFIGALKMAYVVFPSVSSAKVIFQVSVKIYEDLFRLWKGALALMEEIKLRLSILRTLSEGAPRKKHTRFKLTTKVDLSTLRSKHTLSRIKRLWSMRTGFANL